MLTKIDVTELPQIKTPMQNIKAIPKANLIKSVASCEAISHDGLLQVLVAILYQQNNPQFPAITSLPHGLSVIEALSLSTVQALLGICNEVCFIMDGNSIWGLYVKGLADEAINEYLKIREQGKIDNCIKTIFREYNDSANMQYGNMGIYEYEQSNSVIDIENVSINQFFIYLMVECIRYGGAFGLPLLGWSLEEIENCTYFKEMTNVFKRVCFIGSGDKWTSTHLIVSELQEGISKLMSFYISDKE